MRKGECPDKEEKTVVLKKYVHQISNCCIEVVALKKCEEVASPKIKLPEKVATYTRREITIWKEKETKWD